MIVSVRVRPVLAALLALSTLALAQSGSQKKVTCTFVLAATTSDAPKDGTLMLLREEGKLAPTCAFMPGATAVDVMAYDINPATNKATFTGHTIYYTAKATEVQAFTGTWDNATLTGAGRATILGGRGAMQGIKGSATFTLKGNKDNVHTTVTETFTYTIGR